MFNLEKDNSCLSVICRARSTSDAKQCVERARAAVPFELSEVVPDAKVIECSVSFGDSFRLCVEVLHSANIVAFATIAKHVRKEFNCEVVRLQLESRVSWEWQDEPQRTAASPFYPWFLSLAVADNIFASAEAMREYGGQSSAMTKYYVAMSDLGNAMREKADLPRLAHYEFYPMFVAMGCEFSHEEIEAFEVLQRFATSGVALVEETPRVTKDMLDTTSRLYQRLRSTFYEVTSA